MPFPSTSVTYEDRLAEAITRRSVDAEIQPLESSLSLKYLLDANFCKIMSRELAKDDRAWEVKRATPDLWQQLPNQAGLYMFVLTPHLRFKMAHPIVEMALPRTLYVGKAGGTSSRGTLRSRYQAEYKNYVCRNPDLLWQKCANDRSSTLKKYLNLWPLNYWYLEMTDVDAIGLLEKGLIKLLNPPLNNQGVAKMRPMGPPVAAF